MMADLEFPSSSFVSFFFFEFGFLEAFPLSFDSFGGNVGL